MSMCVAMVTIALVVMGLKNGALTENRYFNRSRRYIAFAFLVVAAQACLHNHFEFRSSHPSMGIALDITCYFLLLIIFSLGYFPMIDEYYHSAKRIYGLLAMWLACSALTWTAAIFTYGVASKVLLTIGGSLFLISLFFIFRSLYTLYSILTQTITEQAIQNVEGFSRFLYRSLVIVGLSGVLAFTATLIDDLEFYCYFNCIETLLLGVLGISFVNYVANTAHHAR